MAALTPAARDTIRHWYQGDDPRIQTTIAGYIRRGRWSDGKWHGDACGCTDDRCKDGYHHEPHEECGCLPALLEEWVRDQKAALIWEAHQRGEVDDLHTLEGWVTRYFPNAIASSLDVEHNGDRGITITYPANGRPVPEWAADAGRPDEYRVFAWTAVADDEAAG